MPSMLWVIMVIVSLVFGLISHKTGEISAGAIAGASSAVELCCAIAGPLCLWSGVGTLLERSGLRDALAMALKPALGRLFPTLREDRTGFSALCANVTANLFGLGNAATPMGIEACKAMDDHSGIATKAQCRLVVLNTASIQLIPTTISALRAGLGAQKPMEILPCVLLSSLCSVSAGLILCMGLERVFHVE